MKRYLCVVLFVSLLAAVLFLASCGRNGSASQEESASGDAQEETTCGMASMDHGSMKMSLGETALTELIVDGE